ncbi:MAG: aminoacyl-tRNA hydrolase [Alphaproteobacteria bacterium]|nr:aminoacyl-tRNA hydrolase [Alphaproteobacteria bacterium]MBN2675054.1 aminoacyl-tRNA hydrolase [Alphaproteobacteria bacterium]
MQENKPVLIVGLGNPGDNYRYTRHNVGFMAVDFLAGSDSTWKKEKDAQTTHINVDGYKVIIAKPQTFMNNSGIPVQALMVFYKIPLENLIVIHDDMDLKTGSVREKIGGGSAGHNGIKSLDNNVGKDYTRIRIGIGHPRDTGSLIDPSDWVLGKFSSDELKEIKSAIKTIKIID